MPRPTPARILYLVVGLALGLVGMLALQSYLLPSLGGSLPFGFGAAPAPAAPTGPSGGPAPATLEPETFQVADDRGTAYTLSPLGTAAAASAGFTAGMVSFTPAPP